MLHGIYKSLDKNIIWKNPSYYLHKHKKTYFSYKINLNKKVKNGYFRKN
jgi:predicted porin